MPGTTPVQKVLGVVGTACGGTSFVAHRLQEMGYGIGHERMSLEGICCGFFFLNLHPRYRYNFHDYEFDILCRLIRHPLRALETLPRLSRLQGKSEIAIATTSPWGLEPDPVRYALRWWVETHEALQGEDLVVRVCHMEEDLPKLVEAVAASTRRPPLFGPYARNPRSKNSRWPQMNWDELEQLDEGYAERARVLVDRFNLKLR